MITDSPDQFLAAARALPTLANARTTARAAMLVAPDRFRLSTQSASDNAYMDIAREVDPERALAQHRVLAEAIRRHARIAVQVFPGHERTPDAVFPNNAFACTPGRLVVGAMRHPERRLEAQRDDIPDWFVREHGYAVERLQRDGVVTELTGPLVIDHAREIGFHGMTERLNRAGVEATQRALGLRLGFVFALAAGEYHTNVVMSVLAGRALVIHPGSFDDARVPAAIAALYAPHVVTLSDAEKLAFAGNCIALAPDQVWMSATAERSLSLESRAVLARAGFIVYSVEIDEIEKAGGSLRCCVAEIF